MWCAIHGVKIQIRNHQYNFICCKIFIYIQLATTYIFQFTKKSHLSIFPIFIFLWYLKRKSFFKQIHIKWNYIFVNVYLSHQFDYEKKWHKLYNFVMMFQSQKLLLFLFTINFIFALYITSSKLKLPCKHITLFWRPSNVHNVKKTLNHRSNNVLC